MLASSFTPGPLPSLPLCQQNQEVTKVLWTTPGDTCLQLLRSTSLSPRPSSLADYLDKSTMTPESPLTQDRCAAPGSGWQGQDGRMLTPDRVSVGPEYTSMGEGSVQNSSMGSLLKPEFSKNIGSSAMRSTLCTTSQYAPACFSGGQNWCLFHFGLCDS